jgi:hypothetical protein
MERVSGNAFFHPKFVTPVFRSVFPLKSVRQSVRLAKRVIYEVEIIEWMTAGKSMNVTKTYYRPKQEPSAGAVRVLFSPFS